MTIFQEWDLRDQTAPVYLAKEDGFYRLYLNRAPKKNALTIAMWQAIGHACQRVSESSDTKGLILQSAVSGVFASGIDIEELALFKTDADRREENRLAVRAAQRGLAALSIPTIALIDGPAVGGGCGLAVHCDLRLASDRAVFGVTPARLGLTYPHSDLARLVDVVGSQNARRLLLTAELVDANEAFRLGLVDFMVEACMFEAEAQNLLGKIAQLSPHSLRSIKAGLTLLNHGQKDDDDATINAFLDAHEGPDAPEGIAAFLSKRPAGFGGS